MTTAALLLPHIPFYAQCLHGGQRHFQNRVTVLVEGAL